MAAGGVKGFRFSMKAKATAEPPRAPRQEEKSIQFIFFSSYLGVLGGSAVAFICFQEFKPRLLRFAADE
jgi:hypothetical protein